jgi:uncharacterized protein YfaS (alpha-2-macroglobulin family)
MMNAHLDPKKPSALWLLSLAALLLAALLIWGAAETTEAASKDSTVVTYSRGVLHVAIPYETSRAGAGQLTVEVLDPDDRLLGHIEHRTGAAEGQGRWQEDIRLAKPSAIEDLVWHRVRYRFKFDNANEAPIEGIESISQTLRSPVIHILGQNSYLAGGDAAIRVVVTDSKNETISGAGTVRIEMGPDKGKDKRLLYSGKLNARGTVEAQFRFPAGIIGAQQLRYEVETAIGSAEFTQQVKLEDKVSILLTTEKPLYQPGQTIHVRALALDRAHHEAAAAHQLTFEVEDSRGNKVFKNATQTDKFGVASAEFKLADEVNLGTYHLRALMDTNTAEVALNVQRYVLPKFKVAVEFGKTKHGYRPGDHVTGTVRANYFFGKPVDGAEITVKGTGMDVATFEAGSVQGKTDRDGAYHFDLTLPTYFAGRPLSNGAARVLVEATVKDSAGHAETRGEPITVSQSPLIVTGVAEGGKLIPGLDNQVFLLASYADGQPATADLTVHAEGQPNQKVSTDAGGVAVVKVRAVAGTKSLNVEAQDKEGNRASSSVPLDVRAGDEQILLRAEKAVYKAGERIDLKVFSTKEKGTAYVDVIKEGQTILTRDLDIAGGKAELTLAATPELAGTLDFNAYLFGRDARPAGDHRLVFVQPADELKIDASTDARVYKPGDEARVRFRVTNSRGEGVQAALGLRVVDEAVFALAEKQPGFAKVFFYLEQEALKPRYEIHSIGMSDIVEPVPVAQAEQRDRAARALFAATEMVGRNRFETEFGRSIPMTKYADYSARYRTRFVAQVQQLPVSSVQSGGTGPRDVWNTPVRIESVPWAARPNYYLVRSAGPDKSFNTADDLNVYVEVQGHKSVGKASSGPSRVDVEVEHDRGPFNGRAEIVGSVIDQWGGALEGAVVTAGDRRAVVNADGRFQLPAIPAGDYEVSVTSGQDAVTRKISLGVRDSAILSVMIRKKSSGAKLAVVDFPQGRMRRFEFLRDGVAGGVAGGILQQAPRAMMMASPPAPAQAAAPMKASLARSSVIVNKEEAEPAAPRVRSYFPEALYINPEIITDQNGNASISIPLADSITTWRMSMLASTTKGALGSGTSSIKVFQDFFADLDLPVTLTQGDRVSIPVAVYNYSAASGDVRLELQPADWYALVNDNATKTLTVDSGRVGGSQFTLEARRIGKFKLTLAARMTGGPNADIIVREIEVIPNGREQNIVFNGRLENSVEHAVNFPQNAVPDAGKLFVRLYPGPLSQVIEGMDAILRMPGGCFEQTSSSTYPNILALDYMKRTKKLTPEVHAKAEGFIANGYQRLLTFEVPGGGFSWFGNPPANKILTSYGLMEFSDMSKVYDVDPKVIQRTQQWLASQQQADGSWKPDANFINEGATNRYNKDLLRITAYIGWALENTGYQGPAVEKAKQYVAQHMNEKPDAYTLAVLANFAADYGKDRDFTRQAMDMLLNARTEKDDKVWWSAEETGVYATGASAAVETTGLATQALLKWGQASGTATKTLSYIASKKDATGAWGTTQATIMALRALVLSTEKGAADVRGDVEISLNGKVVQKLTLTPQNNDLLHQFVFKASDLQQANAVAVRFAGKGGLAYQVVGQYFVPWNEKPANEALSIGVTYDRTQLAQDDIATATATIKNNLPKVANMVMVDLGIPPGFDLLSEDLQDMQEKTAGKKGGRLEKFSLTATQAILYFDSIGAGDTVTVRCRLRAKYPIRARTFQSRVYEYYDPAVQAVARPVQLEVRKK